MNERQPAASNPGRANATGHLEATIVILAIGGVLTLLAPLTLPVAIVAGLVWYVVGGRARWLLLAGVVCTAGAVVMVGPASIVSGWHRWAAFPQVSGPVRYNITNFVLGFGPVGPAAGLLLAGVWAGLLSSRARSDADHPLHARLTAQEARRRRRRAQRCAAHLASHRTALAVVVGGQRIERHQRRYWRIRWAWAGWAGPCRVLVPTKEMLTLPAAIVGMPGGGKTTLICRLAWVLAAHGVKFFLIDAKGTDPGLPEHVLSAYRARRPDAVTLNWPAQAVNGWTCKHPDELVGRCLRVTPYSEEHYRAGAKETLQLACGAPSVEPFDSAELIRRIDINVLADLWGDDPVQLARVDGLVEDDVLAVRRRFSQYFHALQGALDGEFPFELADVAVFTVQGLGDPEAARTAVGWILADLEHYAGIRKPRDGRKAVAVLDELSALGDAAEQVLNLMQRGRDPGVAVVPSTQSLGDFGDDQQAHRLYSSAPGGLFVLASQDGERLAHLAGHEQDGTRRLDPDELGSADAGELQLVHKRHRLRLQVIANAPKAMRDAYTRTAVEAEVLAEEHTANGPLWAYLHRMAERCRELAPIPRVPSGTRALPSGTRHPIVVRALRLPIESWWTPFVLWVRALTARLRRVRRG